MTATVYERDNCSAEVLVLGLQRTQWLPEVCFKFPSNLIGKSTMASFTGQSWRVLKSWYADRGLKQGFWRCFSDVTNLGLITSATEAIYPSDFSSAVSGFCQVFIVSRAKSFSRGFAARGFGQHRKFPPHASKNLWYPGQRLSNHNWTGVTFQCSLLTSKSHPRQDTRSNLLWFNSCREHSANSLKQEIYTE